MKSETIQHTQKWETHPITDTNVVYWVDAKGEAHEIYRTPGNTTADKAEQKESPSQ